MKTVVVCASDRFARRLIALSLGGLGCGVVELSKSSSLHDLCGRGGVALVVMLGAGEALGPLFHRSRQDSPFRRVPLWLLSWHHTAGVATALLEQGVAQCMTFPCSLSRLRRKAEVLLKSLPRHD